MWNFYLLSLWRFLLQNTIFDFHYFMCLLFYCNRQSTDGTVYQALHKKGSQALGWFAFLVCRSSFEPSCSLHEIQYAPNFTLGRLGGSPARPLVVFLCEFGASWPEDDCFVSKFKLAPCQLLLIWSINKSCFHTPDIQHNYTLLWACLREVTAAVNMFSQHVYQNCFGVF